MKAIYGNIYYRPYTVVRWDSALVRLTVKVLKPHYVSFNLINDFIPEVWEGIHESRD